MRYTAQLFVRHGHIKPDFCFHSWTLLQNAQQVCYCLERVVDLMSERRGQTACRRELRCFEQCYFGQFSFR